MQLFLKCAFFRKKNNRQILLRLNCASGEFFAAQLLFSESFSENNVAAGKKAAAATTIHSFFLHTAFDKKKYCAEKENEFFFRMYSLYSAKKLLSIKMGSNFFAPPNSPHKKHISDKNFLLLFSSSFFIFSLSWIFCDNRLCRA